MIDSFGRIGGGAARRWLALCLLLLAAASLAACGARAPAPSASGPAGSYGYKVGQPYQIRGVWYTPEEDFHYDRTGIASWYGPGFHGRRTANGEIYDQHALTAAHPTLQMPALVRVTNLDNGRSLVLRINDRGPFAQNRIIDVSQRAAEELGFRRQGTARVRVQVLAEESRQLAQAAGRTGREPGTSPSTSPNVAVASRPVAAQPVSTAAAPPAAPVSTAGSVFIQAGAFSSFDNAAAVRTQLASLAPTEIRPTEQQGQTLYRVRVGPFRNVAEAERVLTRVREVGMPDARLTVDS